MLDVARYLRPASMVGIGTPPYRLLDIPPTPGILSISSVTTRLVQTDERQMRCCIGTQPGAFKISHKNEGGVK
jgi:hypothetical protein